MPLYSFRCSNGHGESLFAKIAERDAVRQCPRCGANLLRLFEAPAIHAEITPYQSPVDGRWIDSKAARREDLKRTGSIEWEPGIRQDLPRMREANDEKAFAPMGEAIDQTVRDMVAAGKIDPL